MKQFQDRVAIVTGAGSGIGLATARLLAQRGAAVVALDIDGDSAQAATEQIEREGGRAMAFMADVADAGAAHRAVKDASARFGGVDLLFSNAGVAIGGAADTMAEGDWRRTIEVNLGGVWNCLRAVAPVMRERGRGAIVHCSSVQAHRGFQNWAAYSASKGAIEALTRQAAVEYAADGVRVNAVAPGTITTPMVERIVRSVEGMEGGEETMRAWREAQPMCRFGEPREVAEVVCFLLSDAASFVTGVTIPVDGGLLAKG